MATYLWLILYTIVAELVRRIVLTIIHAYTGPLSKIPGPQLSKLTSIFWHLRLASGDFYYELPRLFEKYGDTVRVSPNAILIKGKETAQQLLVDNVLKKSPVYDGFRSDRYHTDIFTERDKDAHKHRRRLLSNGFSINYLNHLEPAMMECVDAFQEFLEQKCEEGHGSAEVDMFSNLANVTADVLTATVFGESWNLTKTNNTHLKEIFAKQLRTMLAHAQIPFLKYIPFMPSPVNHEIEDRLNGILTKRRSVDKKEVKKDLLQMLIDTKEKYPNDYKEGHIKADMILFMIAGTDTSSVTLTFCLLLLLNNPDKLAKLAKELDEAFTSRDDPITFEKTLNLPYLNAALNESMRVMPVAIAFARQSTETIVVNGYEIPPDTHISIDLAQLGRDPKYWPDPELFIPERWLAPYKGHEVDRKATLPFSTGPRNCIGMQFALRELRLLLAMMVRKFELSLVPNQSHELRLFLVPTFASKQYLVGLQPRD
ncbi:cytochrome P450 [Rhexocercosporidium sp. MPI-PUGE-AT-0058]|nr:cytochrome P450 [Rhexocercosporidium sp. MPI-PUGE-AT-0058]